MKRRIFAIVLAIAMLCPMMLTGCNTNTEETSELNNEQTTRATVSINMWVVTDKNTTEDAKAAVEEEFNRITKSSFTTKVDLVFVTEDEYVEALNNKFEAAAEAKANNNTPATPESTDDTTVVEELETNEYGVSVLKYPEITEDQIDIVYIQGFDHLYDLVKGGTTSKLKNLNEHISNTGRAKILTDVIGNDLFKYTKIDGNTYGIPNNRVVGEYTYLLVSKEIVGGDANGDGTVSPDEINGTYYNFNDISTFFDCAELIDYVKNNRSDLVPVLEKFDNPYIYYWDDNSEFSILGSKATFNSQKANANDEYFMKNIFTIKEFTEFELLMKKYETNGYFAADADKAKEAQNFGVAVMSGDSTIPEEYSDKYFVKVISTPTLTNENVFTSFFGITEYCKNVDRALEIITMLNTDSELRNVLQYGVDGVHYELDENERVERFNKDYIMNIENTGNVFIAYPEEGMDDDVWTRGVKSNLDLRVHALTGLWNDWLKVDKDILTNLSNQSKSFKDRLDACKTVEELQTFFETAKAEVDENEAFKAATSTENAASPKAVYSKWYTTTWPTADV